MKKGNIAIKMFFGCCAFALGFNWFLEPNGLNAGGISGLSMVLVFLIKTGTIGLVAGILNLPLFALAGIKVGRRFFVLSLIGMLLSSLLLDAFAYLPRPQVDPLLACLYGGVLCGIGSGLVFTTGGSTGGSDIIVRLLKLRYPNLQIGVIYTGFDLAVAAITGIAFADVGSALYSAVAIVVSGRVIDAVAYRFDYSRVALIISAQHEEIACAVAKRLGRGATFLHAEGSFSHKDTKVVLTAVRRQQLAELKRLVVEIDPDAFIIVQEAHQVLGDGFLRYSKDAL